MIVNSIEQYNLLKADTVFTFVCTSCGGTFEKRKRRGKRGETFNFLCQREGYSYQHLLCNNGMSADQHQSFKHRDQP